MRTVYASFKCKDNCIDVSPCAIESVVELPAEEYRRFSKNLLGRFDFIRDCKAPLHQDSMGVNHCLLVLGEGSNDGILVRSEGSDYARYSAYLPNARQFLRQEMHPSMAIFEERMVKLVDQFARSAIVCQDDGCYSLSIESVRRRAGEDHIDANLFATMLSERPEFQLVEMDEDRIHAFLEEKYVVMEESPDVRHLSKREVTTMVAKHQLWLNGDGGECADFSNCYLDNYQFPYAQLRGANFDNATLVNVSLSNADLTEGSFGGTKFVGCDMRNVKAKDAYFKDAVFRDTDLAWITFSHSNLKNATFTGCELEYAEYVDCCIENTHFDEFGRLPTEMRDCSFDEEEWVAEQGMEMKR